MHSIKTLYFLALAYPSNLISCYIFSLFFAPSYCGVVLLSTFAFASSLFLGNSLSFAWKISINPSNSAKILSPDRRIFHFLAHSRQFTGLLWRLTEIAYMRIQTMKLYLNIRYYVMAICLLIINTGSGWGHETRYDWQGASIERRHENGKTRNHLSLGKGIWESLLCTCYSHYIFVCKLLESNSCFAHFSIF